MEKARYNTELYSNLSEPLNNVKPSNFWGSHHNDRLPITIYQANIRVPMRGLMRRGWLRQTP